MKAFRARAAARYLAQRIADARLSAIRRSASQGLRFEPASPDYRVSLVADGNGNGLRTAEIQRGIDRPLTEPELLGWHSPDVTFGIQDDVPDADGRPANGSDGARVGSSRLLSMNPDGTSSSGTLYIHGRARSQYAIRTHAGHDLPAAASVSSASARGAAGDLIPAFGVECAGVFVKGTK